MSWMPDQEPECHEQKQASIARVIVPRARDLGDFTVRRVLPSGRQQMVGPFIFFDHMGPATFAVSEGMDVRPHPHIGLATVTYLFNGSILHRDSLGSEQLIVPGAINWMLAGKGIVHSERTPYAMRAQAEEVEGLQLWVALPTDLEETEPAFTHYAAQAIPEKRDAGVYSRVLAGQYAGLTSPVQTQSPLFYVEVRLDAQAHTVIESNYTERAIYIVSGKLVIDEQEYDAAQMLVLAPGEEIPVTALTDSHFVVLGGEPLDGARHVWWNFVSSRLERIEQAKQDWREKRFPCVPGETEWIPLPEK